MARLSAYRDSEPARENRTGPLGLPQIAAGLLASKDRNIPSRTDFQIAFLDIATGTAPIGYSQDGTIHLTKFFEEPSSGL